MQIEARPIVVLHRRSDMVTDDTLLFRSGTPRGAISNRGRSRWLPRGHFAITHPDWCAYRALLRFARLCRDHLPEYHFLLPYGHSVDKAIAVVAMFALVAVVFVYADFSFGYFVGFYLYTMVVGYLWLNSYSEFVYNHHLTGLSAAASAVAFLLPVLFIRAPLRAALVAIALGFRSAAGPPFWSSRRSSSQSARATISGWSRSKISMISATIWFRRRC